jgi:hypothetical protein
VSAHRLRPISEGHLEAKFYPLRQRLYELSTRNGSLLTHKLAYYQFPGYLDLAINDTPAAECQMRETKVLPQYLKYVYCTSSPLI